MKTQVCIIGGGPSGLFAVPAFAQARNRQHRSRASNKRLRANPHSCGRC